MDNESAHVLAIERRRNQEWRLRLAAVESEGMETDRVGRQGRRCKQVAAAIDEYRLEMERTRSQERRQRRTVEEKREVRLEMERTRSQES